MNNISKKIIDVSVQNAINVILEADITSELKPLIPTTRVCVYAGRFQPFHINHYNVYKLLCNRFGKENVYIATSNTVESITSPFNFEQKKKIMMMMFNIPEDKIYMVRKPYNPQEILQKFDPKTTVYFAAVGSKDATRLQSGKYFIGNNDYTLNQQFFYPFEKNGYIYEVELQTPEYNGHVISGSIIREIFSNNKYSIDKKKQIFNILYNRFDIQIFKLFIHVFGGTLNQGLIHSAGLSPMILKEGGSYGHISHLWQDQSLTFGQLKEIIKSTLYGQQNNKITAVTIKEDGRQMSVSYRNNRLVAALNDNQLKNNGANALSSGVFETFVNSKTLWPKQVKQAYIVPFRILNKQFNDPQYLNSVFQNGKVWASIQLISSKAPMLIPSNRNVIQFHGLFQYDQNTKAKPLDNSSMYEFVQNLIKDSNEKIKQEAEEYYIQPPTPAVWPKPQKPIKQLQKYLSQIDELISANGVTSNTTISKYIQVKWRKYILSRLSQISDEQFKKQLINSIRSNINDRKIKEQIINNYIKNLKDAQKQSIKDKLFEQYIGNDKKTNTQLTKEYLIDKYMHTLSIKIASLQTQKDKQLKAKKLNELLAELNRLNTDKKFKTQKTEELYSRSTNEIKLSLVKQYMQLMKDEYEKYTQYMKDYDGTESNSDEFKQLKKKATEYQQILKSKEALTKKAEQLFAKQIKEQSDERDDEQLKLLSDEKWVERKKEQLFNQFVDKLDTQKLVNLYIKEIDEQMLKDRRNKLYQILLKRFTKSNDQKNVSITWIKKRFGDKIQSLVKQIDNDFTNLSHQFIYKIQLLISKVQQQILKLIWSKLQLSDDKKIQHIKSMIYASINQLKNAKTPKQMQKLERNISKLKQMVGSTTLDDALKNIIPIQGIVFKYNGKQYKYTGMFAPINQLFGAIRFNEQLMLNISGTSNQSSIASDAILNIKDSDFPDVPIGVKQNYQSMIFDDTLSFEDARKDIENVIKTNRQQHDIPEDESTYNRFFNMITNSKNKKELYINMLKYHTDISMKRYSDARSTPSKKNKIIDSEISKEYITSMSKFLHDGSIYMGNLIQLIKMLYKKDQPFQQKKKAFKYIILDRADKRVSSTLNTLYKLHNTATLEQLQNIAISSFDNILFYGGGITGAISKKKQQEIKYGLSLIRDHLIQYKQFVFSNKHDFKTKKQNILRIIQKTIKDTIAAIELQIETQMKRDYKKPEDRNDVISLLRGKIVKIKKISSTIQKYINESSSPITLFTAIIAMQKIKLSNNEQINSILNTSFLNKYIDQMITPTITRDNFEEVKNKMQQYLKDIVSQQIKSPRSPYLRKLLSSIQQEKSQIGIMSYLYNIILASYQLGVATPVKGDILPVFAQLRAKLGKDYHNSLRAKQLDYEFTSSQLEKISNALLTKQNQQKK